jgi:chemotaxis protein CheD
MANSSIGTRDDLDRIHDRVLEKDVVRLMPGEFFVSRDAEVLTTVLGSCISACIRDKQRNIGGMNHFMLPDAGMGGAADKATAGRYGTHAMQYLIDGIVSLGGNIADLEVKIFGGGRIVEGMSDVGAKNIEFIRQYLNEAGIPIHAEDVGLAFPRKINYFVDTGRVMVKKLRAIHSRSILAEEKSYCQNIPATEKTEHRPV